MQAFEVICAAALLLGQNVAYDDPAGGKTERSINTLFCRAHALLAKKPALECNDALPLKS